MDAFKKAMDQAQQAAQQAASQAKVAGTQVQQKMGDPATQAQARVQMAKAGVEARRVAGKARRGLTTIVEKIDPALLADVVIKATALQEKANGALRAKRSPYRIGEVVISAAIPPQVSFAIVRIDDVEEELTGDVRESSELVDVATGEEGAVLALDGSGPPVDEIEEPDEVSAGEAAPG
ncbi:MAG TPA: hypothetical protein VFP83_02385 [Candidatus Limnocylindria bacterium]|nr:hypothetical protein [Candidatus Limnocylindria bacterium]